MTTSSPMIYMKLYTNLLDDVAFNRLSDATKLRYVYLLMLAGRLDAGGAFIEDGEELSTEDIAWKLRISTEQLATDLEALSQPGLVVRNGRGWELPRFSDEQGPAQADKRAAWAERQRKHREKKTVTRDTGVSNALLTRLESESESEKSQSQSQSQRKEESSSSVLTSNPETFSTDAAAAEVTAKLTALQISGVPTKYHKQISQDATISTADIWAELTRCFERKDVRKPEIIMPMNLIKGERPAADYYDPDLWRSHIPNKILQAAGLLPDTIEEQDEEVYPDKFVTTRIFSELHTEGAKVWASVLDQLSSDVPRASFNAHLAESVATALDGSLLTVAVQSDASREWLEGRMSKTVSRLLIGLLNKGDASVKFVVPADIQAEVMP